MNHTFSLLQVSQLIFILIVPSNVWEELLSHPVIIHKLKCFSVSKICIHKLSEGIHWKLIDIPKMMLDKQSNIQVWNSILNVIFSASTKHHWLHYYISLLRPSVYQNWIKYFLKRHFQFHFHKIFLNIHKYWSQK